MTLDVIQGEGGRHSIFAVPPAPEGKSAVITSPA